MVDILLTCAGEEVATILDTLKAAVAIDWPRDRMRVVVLDDKADEEVRRGVLLLGLENSNIHYSARVKTKGVPHHFKAGNLNHGLSYLEGIGGEKAEYVAALDADMIVETSWLRAIVGHLILDPEIALACPPQVSRHHSPSPGGSSLLRLDVLYSSVFRLISSSSSITYQKTTHFIKT